MLVVDLHCEQGHHFEGWFASAEDLASQQARGLVSCPVCGTLGVQRRPSAPRLNVSGATVDGAMGALPARAAAGTRGATPGRSNQPAAPGGEVREALQAMYAYVVRKVVENTDDVGRHFAEQVRRMHHGDEPARAIRGQATQEEKAALREEGIDVLSLPVPEGFDGPLQ